MKKIFFMSFFIMSCVLNLSSLEDVSKETKLIYEILDQAACNIQKKHNLYPIGFSISMPGGPLRELGLELDSYSQLNKDQLRKLALASAKEIFTLVEASTDILNIVYNPPFTIKNVRVTIYNHNKNNGRLHDPEISVARIVNGKVSFSTLDKISNNGYKNTIEETYEEAITLIE